MSLSKKHFEAIALICKRLGDGEADWGGMGELVEKDDLVFSLVRYFQEENPNFNANRFVIACGYPVENDLLI
jgi:hypothetical protein